jgi:hypothetical protein
VSASGVLQCSHKRRKDDVKWRRFCSVAEMTSTQYIVRIPLLVNLFTYNDRPGLGGGFENYSVVRATHAKDDGYTRLATR